MLIFLVFDRHSLQLRCGLFIEISTLYSGLHPSVAVAVQFSDESFALIALNIGFVLDSEPLFNFPVFVFGCNHLEMTNCAHSVETAR